MNYRQYISSPQWREKRRQFFASKMNKCHGLKGKWRCVCCMRDDVPLDLHHRTYKRLGNERINVDLIPVCRPCHDEIHDLTRAGIHLWKATKQIRREKRKEWRMQNRSSHKSPRKS